MSMADKIAVMNHGVIEQFGTPKEIYDRPASMYVADFIGSPPMNFLPADTAIGEGAALLSVDGAAVPVPQTLSGTAKPVLGIRPEHVRLDDNSKLRGAVYATEYLGSTQIIAVDTKAGRIKARTGPDVRLEPGAPVGLSFQTSKLSLFDKDSGKALAMGGIHG